MPNKSKWNKVPVVAVPGWWWLCQGCCWSGAGCRKLPFLLVGAAIPSHVSFFFLQCTFSPRSQCCGGAEHGDFTLIIFQAFRELFFTHGHNLTPELCSCGGESRFCSTDGARLVPLSVGLPDLSEGLPDPSEGLPDLFMGCHCCHSPTEPRSRHPLPLCQGQGHGGGCTELCVRVFSRINYL